MVGTAGLQQPALDHGAMSYFCTIMAMEWESYHKLPCVITMYRKMQITCTVYLFITPILKIATNTAIIAALTTIILITITAITINTAISTITTITITTARR